MCLRVSTDVFKQKLHVFKNGHDPKSATHSEDQDSLDSYLAQTSK